MAVTSRLGPRYGRTQTLAYRCAPSVSPCPRSYIPYFPQGSVGGRHWGTPGRCTVRVGVWCWLLSHRQHTTPLDNIQTGLEDALSSLCGTQANTCCGEPAVVLRASQDLWVTVRVSGGAGGVRRGSSGTRQQRHRHTVTQTCGCFSSLRPTRAVVAQGGPYSQMSTSTSYINVACLYNNVL